MLRSLVEPEGYKLDASDGAIGHCRDFLFDDQDWTVRYMVADTGGWLSGRKVLISPAQLGQPDWERRRLPVSLTSRQIEDSPPLDSDAPVSRQYEQTFNAYHSLPAYWLGSGLWGSYPLPSDMTQPIPQTGVAPAPPAREEPQEPVEAPSTHLRSLEEVRGYAVLAADDDDGRVGQLADLIIDDSTWAVRHLVLDTSRLPFSKKVLLPVAAVDTIDWAERRIYTSAGKRQIEESPEFDPRQPVTEKQEAVLYDYYGRPRGRASETPEDR
jgi:hypothetical protein